MSLTNQNMTRQILIQVAVLAWIVTIFATIASGPLINKCLLIEGDINRSNAHKKLQSLNVSASSEFDGIKNTTNKILIDDAIFLALVGVVSAILTAMAFKPKHYWTLYPAILSTVFLVFLVLTLLTGIFYVELFNARIDPYKTDFSDGMISSLHVNFLNDSLNTGSDISNGWNTLFMDYECCGVNKVAGTTNDFDNTPWCTSSGSCQATASQIPKTCCKGSTKYNYQNAPSACHSSVNPGEYYDKGCYNVIKEDVIKERIRFDSFTDDILTEGLTVVLVMGFCSLLSLVGGCVFFGIWKKGRNNTEQNASNGPQVSHQPPTDRRAHRLRPTSQTDNASNMTARANGGTRHLTAL